MVVSSFGFLLNSGSPRARTSELQDGGKDVLGLVAKHSLSLRRGNEVSDAAIHSMQWIWSDNTGSLLGSQWIATGFYPLR